MADWDDRLLSRSRALELVGDWPVRVCMTSLVGARVVIRCARCEQSCGDFTAGITSPDDIVAAVLRHAVTAHELSLSGRS